MRRICLTIACLLTLILAAPAAFAQTGGGAPADDGERETTDDEQAEADDRSDDERPEPAEEDGAEPNAEDAQAADEATAYDSAATTSSTAESKASKERTIPGGTLALISYIVLWLMTMAFIGVTVKRQSELARELETLEGRMDDVLGPVEDEV